MARDAGFAMGHAPGHMTSKRGVGVIMGAKGNHGDDHSWTAMIACITLGRKDLFKLVYFLSR